MVHVGFVPSLPHVGAQRQQDDVLDWYHLHQKCRELSSRICRGKQAKRWLLLQLERRLWRGDVAAAIALLEAYRAETRNTQALDTFIM